MQKRIIVLIITLMITAAFINCGELPVFADTSIQNESVMTENVSVMAGKATTSYYKVVFPTNGTITYGKPILSVVSENSDIALAKDAEIIYGIDGAESYINFLFQGITEGQTTITVSDYSSGATLKVFNVTVTSPETETVQICTGETMTVPVDYNSNSSGVSFRFNTSVDYENATIDADSQYVFSNRVRYNYTSLDHYYGNFSICVNSIGNYQLFLYDDENHHIKTVDLNVQDHSYNIETTVQEKNCSQHEIVEYTCSNCGKKKQVEGSEYGEHQWSSYFAIDRIPSCTEEGSESIHCSVCNAIDEATVTVIPKADHIYGDWQVTKGATCVAEGSKEKVCSICGDKVIETISATGHSFEEAFTVDLEPSCTGDGSKSRHCMKCDEVTDVTVIQATGHTFGEWVEVTPSTCEDSGLEKRSCETCGVVESRNMDPNGHDFDDEYTIDVEATCTTDGSQSKHCRNCDAVIDSEVIPAFGHSYGEWTTTQEPTCVDAGSKNQVCSTCGDKDVQEIPATGIHTYGDWITIKEPTLDEEGSKEHTCSVCGHAESEMLPKIPAQPIADEAIADAEEARTAAEKAAKDAEEAQRAADEAAKTPGEAAVAAAKDAKTAAEAAKEAADAYNEAAEKADQLADKAIVQAETDEAKTAANASKETSSALVTAAETAVDNANKAVETAAASVTAAENAKMQAEQAATKKAQEEAAAKQKADAEKALIAANNGIIDPSLPKVKISKPKAAKKSMTVKWKKLTKKQLKNVKGIEVEYSLTSDFQDPVFKSVGKKKANAKIKKLLSKKTYYVRAHTYVVRGGKKYVSNWSITKKVKIK